MITCLRQLPVFIRVFFAAFVGLLPVACTASEEAAGIANAPAIIAGGLASINDIAASLAAANQQVGSSKLNLTTGLAAANAANATLQSSTLSAALTQVFTGIQNLTTSIQTANPAVTPAQLASAQSKQIVASQVALQAAIPPGTSPTARIFRVHYNMFAKTLVIEAVTTPKA
jgi:hypothetical protein